jgi:pimeloyl-ACP methyl ester carboxylesterase
VERTIWGENEGVRIEAIEWSPDVEPSAQGVPLVFVPGGTGNARSAAVHGRPPSGRIGARGRRVLGVSRRGTGLSDAPARGFAPSDFAGDVNAAVAAAGYTRFALFGHSMGVPISIEYALRHPGSVAALAVGDAPSRYVDFKADGTFDNILTWPREFADWDAAYGWMSHAQGSHIPDRAAFDEKRDRWFSERDGKVRWLTDMDAIERTVGESVTARVDYGPRLGEIGCPVLLLLGTAGWSPIRPSDIAAYEERVADLRIARLQTGHDLGQFGDAAALHAELGALLDRVDA